MAQCLMDKKINVVFYKTASGNEPVREWLKSLDAEDRLNVGTKEEIDLAIKRMKEIR